MKFFFSFYLLPLSCFFLCCSAPRTVLNSGKVTPHKTFRGGFDYSVNIATQPVKSVITSASDIIDAIDKYDSVAFGTVISKASATAVAYCLDPIGSGMNFYGRYGLISKCDIGYKFASGVHAVDARYQFLGSAHTFDEPSEKRNYGSIGLQYSSQDYKLPDWTGLKQVQHIIGLEFKRKDFLIPLIFSHSFGPEEKFGAISYGLAYNHSFIKYSFNPSNIYDIASYAGSEIDSTLIPSFSKRNNYPSFGIFTNIKFGYKYLFGLLSFSMYYQKYGVYPVLGNSTVLLKGFSFIPSAGFLFDVPFKKIFRKKEKKEEKG